MGVVSQLIPPCFVVFKIGSFTETWHLWIRLAWLAVSPTDALRALPRAGIISTPHHLSFLNGFWGANSSLCEKHWINLSSLPQVIIYFLTLIVLCMCVGTYVKVCRQKSEHLQELSLSYQVGPGWHSGRQA